MYPIELNAKKVDGKRLTTLLVTVDGSTDLNHMKYLLRSEVEEINDDVN